jgi:hypothetical protein
MNVRLGAIALLGLLVLSGCDSHTLGGGTEGVGISGTLLLPDGSPAAGKKVLAFASDDVGDALARKVTAAATPTPLDSTTTDARGRFHFSRLQPGTYNLAPPMQVGDSVLGWFRRGVAYAGESLWLGRDTLRIAGSLGLQVLANNDVLTGATCFVPGSPYTATTDEQGTCVLMGLPPGTYSIAVTFVGYPVSQTKDSTSVESGLNSLSGAVDISSTESP